ncbi:MAG: HNH endonuclease [Calditrichaeota bacterium]|nr:HNH endonuclease [Calditrichota bacterium]
MKNNRKFKLKLIERNIPSDKLLEDLKRVTNLLQKDNISISEYDNHGNYHHTTFARRFGSWNKAIETAGLTITQLFSIPDDDLLENLLKVWEKLGRQPKYDEMRKPLSLFCAGTYENKFGSWNKALIRFIEWIELSEALEDASTSNIDINEKSVSDKNDDSIYVHKTSRTITQRLRFSVLLRDGFTCCRCGRSPLKEPGSVELEVDHKLAWSKDGETTKDNLETLCHECNQGKSNMEVDYS